MYSIQEISQAPYQQQVLILPDGSQATIVLYFIPLQQSWFLQKLTWGSFVLNNIRITTQPNILYQWKNLLPFGIFCETVGNREPSFQEDFATGASKLYILDAIEVDEFSEYIRFG